jgi:hypothetical protein
MPYVIRKLRNQPFYQVKNIATGEIYAKHTTKAKAEAQVRLLHAKEKK